MNDEINVSTESVTNKKQDTKKIIYIISYIVIVLLITGVIFGPSLFNKNKGTRTIMIYMVGSDLESKYGIATADLNSFIPSKIDLEKTNILLYTGGTESWKNFVKNDENAIYQLKENGFERIASYEKANMGSDDTLSSFLKYSYENFDTEKYVLILYDHGGAIDGAIYDDFTNDNLSLEDFRSALLKSPFNEKNKLEAVIFRTCLNGTVEVANVFHNYANYLIASEEVTRGSATSHVFAPFNEILSTDDSVVMGTKFINDYIEYMKNMDVFDSITSTYSIIDLSKIDDLDKAINNYFKSINVSQNYSEIARVRSKMYSYGEESSEAYGMIDLYTLVDETKSLAKDEAQKLLDILNKTIIFNSSNRDHSKGLSIYFPFSGQSIIKSKFLLSYKAITELSDYNTFINQFDEIKNSKKSYDFVFKTNTLSFEDNKVSYELTEEEKEVFSHARVLVIKKDEEHDGYYYAVMQKPVDLDNNTLKTTFANDFIKVLSEGKYYYIYQTIDNDGVRLIPGVNLSKYDGYKLIETSIVNFIISKFNDNIEITKGTVRSRNERLNGTIVNIADYNSVEYYFPCYKMYDPDGNFVPFYEHAPVYIGEGYTDKNIVDGKYDFKFERTNLVDGEFYAVFAIYDINGNVYYSDLMEVGD